MTLPPVIPGMMRMGKNDAAFSTSDYKHFIQSCIDMGVNWFDHADIYGDHTIEDAFGEVLQADPAIREQLHIITKCGIRMDSPRRPGNRIKHYDSSAKHITESVENSLIHFRTDRIDLLLLHRPDLLMHPDEIARAFTRLREEGKVLHFGASNFSSSQIELVHSVFPLEAHQVEISILALNAFHNGILDQCLQKNIIPMAWSPFGGGDIFVSPETDRLKRLQKIIVELNNTYGCRTDQLLLAWLARHPSGIVPVIGTTKLDRVASVKDHVNIKLSREDWYRLYTASTGKRVA